MMIVLALANSVLEGGDGLPTVGDFFAIMTVAVGDVGGGAVPFVRMLLLLLLLLSSSSFTTVVIWSRFVGDLVISDDGGFIDAR